MRAAKGVVGINPGSRRTNEHANGTRIPRLDALIRSELVRAPELPARDKAAEFVDRADTLFLELVNR